MGATEPVFQVLALALDLGAGVAGQVQGDIDGVGAEALFDAVDDEVGQGVVELDRGLKNLQTFRQPGLAAAEAGVTALIPDWVARGLERSADLGEEFAQVGFVVSDDAPLLVPSPLTSDGSLSAPIIALKTKWWCSSGAAPGSRPGAGRPYAPARRWREPARGHRGSPALPRGARRS